MNYIKILATGSYLPKLEIKNEELEKEYQLEKGYIEKRTGIKRRFYSQNENISYMAIKAVNDLMLMIPEQLNNIQFQYK